VIALQTDEVAPEQRAGNSAVTYHAGLHSLNPRANASLGVALARGIQSGIRTLSWVFSFPRAAFDPPALFSATWSA
jgi:hypothetical protein